MLVTLLAIQGCSSPEEKVASFIEQGKQLFEQKEYDKSAIEFKNAIQINKKNSTAYYYLAQIEEKKQNWQAVYANLTAAVKFDPKNIPAILKLAQMQLISGKTDEALQGVEKVLQLEPENLAALSVKGAVFLKQGNINEAMALADKVLAKDPAHIDAISLKATLLLNAKKADDALALIDTTLKTKPHEINLHMLKMQIHNQLQDKAALEQDYQQLIQEFPDNLDFQFAQAKFYDEINKDKEADAVLKNIIEKHPDNLKAKLVYIDFLASKDSVAALAKTQEFIKQQPDIEELYLHLAKLLVANKQLSEAKQPLLWLTEHKKDSKNALLAKVMLAALALEEKNKAEAEKLLAEVLAVDARQYDAMLLKVKMKLTDNLLDEAVSDLRNILRDYPEKDEALVLLARTYQKQNSPELADEMLHKALEVNPKNFDAILPIVAKLTENKDYARAEELLIKALEISPNNPLALQAMAQVKLLSKDWSGLQRLAEAIATNPEGSGYASYLSGKIFQAQDHYEEAIAQFKQALEKSPTLADALNSIYACYQALKQPEAMLGYLDSVIAAHPDNDLATILKAQILYDNKRADEAMTLINQAIVAKPKVIQYYELMTQFFVKRKEIASALKVLQDGLKNNPDDPRLLMGLASLYEQGSDYQKALETYETLVAKQPGFDIAVNNLVSLLLDRFDTPENISRAAKLSERFKNSKQPYFADSYAWALYKSGKASEAFSISKSVVDTAPNVPVFQYHLGAIYQTLKDPKNAEQALNKALELAGAGEPFAEKELANKLLTELKAAPAP